MYTLLRFVNASSKKQKNITIITSVVYTCTVYIINPVSKVIATTFLLRSVCELFTTILFF